MKDKSLHKVAEHLYVQDFLNLEETAKRVGVNERTIRRWQGQDNWLEKRRQFIEQHSHIHEDLYKLARSTYEIIKEDMKNGDYINPGRLNQLLNLLEAMFKTQKTEQILDLYRNQQPSEPNTEIDFDEIEKQCGVCSSEIISYSKLIRDADKIDIIFQLCSMPKLTNGSGSGYNKKCLKELLDKQSVTIKSDRSVLDVVFAQMGLLFNIYYKESFDKIDLDKFFESRIKFTQNKLNEKDMKILETTIGKVRFLLGE